ncbi:phosphoinositide 5-phosphatase [Theileria orientalis]|uniref:Phosphoinositide 5-phosphatase n=1 Tax=Theileria orientalis TaxID=68886 RepID=A0A976MBW3_THEOR|nr:phosphoinositide 5-phosphatase [Theileria orientalis]
MLISKGPLYLVIYLLSNRLQNLGAFTQSTHIYDTYNYLAPSPGIGDALTVVEIKNQFSTNEIKYRYDPETKFHEFIARNPYLIDKVTKKGRIIWDSANFDYEYGSKVVLGECIGGNRLFRVYFPHELVSSPSDSDAPGISLPKSTPQTSYLLTFDIQDKFTTDKVIYTYDETYDTHRFVSVYPYVFSQIHKNGLIVWEYVEGDYPNEALIFRDDNGKSILRVFLNKPPEIVKHVKRPQLPKHIEPSGPVIKAHMPSHPRVQTEVVKILTPGAPSVDPMSVPTSETERGSSAETERESLAETERESPAESERESPAESERQSPAETDRGSTTETEHESPHRSVLKPEVVKIHKPGAPRVDPISIPTTESERGSIRETGLKSDVVKMVKPGAPRVDPISMPTTETDRGSIRETVLKPEVVKIVKPGPIRVGPIPVPATETDRESAPQTDLETEVETQFQPGTDDEPESVSEIEVPAKSKHEELDSVSEFEVRTKAKLYKKLESESEIDVPSKSKVYKKRESETEIDVPIKTKHHKKSETEPEIEVKVKPRQKFEIIDKRMAFKPKAGVLDLRPVELNLDYKYSTFCFDYTQYNNVGTYIPKEGYAFIVVRFTYKFLIFGTDVVIWRSYSPDLYATKVVFSGISKVANTVKIFLNNGETKVFCKKTDRQIWKEEEDAVPDLPDMLDLDPRLLDIDIENFSRSIVYDIRFIDDHDVGKLNYVYYPKKKYLFKSVMQDSYVIWKARDISECVSVVHVNRYTFPDIINLIIMTPNGNRRLFIKTIPRLCKLPTWKEESLEPLNKRLIKRFRRVVPL